MAVQHAPTGDVATERRRAWTVFSVVFLACVVAAFNQSKVPPLIPALVDEIQLSIVEGGLLYAPEEPVGEGEMPADDEAPREGEEEAAAEAEQAEAEAEAEAEQAQADAPSEQPEAEAPSEGDAQPEAEPSSEGEASEQPAAGAADEAAPDVGDDKQG